MQIVDGIENLTPPTLREKRKLKNRPPNIRLSCQCQVLGDVSVITNQALTYEELYAAPAPKPVPVPAA
jgi:ferredoxin